MKKHALLLSLIVVTTSACTPLGPNKLLNPQEIYPDEPTESRRYDKKATANTAVDGQRPSEFDRFYYLEDLAFSNSSSALEKYVQQGIVLSNTTCDRWFDELEKAQAHVRFWKNNAVITASLATTIMGALEAAAKEIAVVGAAFAGITSGFDNFSGSFLFTPDIELIRKRISDARGEKAQLLNAGIPASLELAKIELQLYHEICSGAEIRRLLNESLELTRFTFHSDSAGDKIRTVEQQLALREVNRTAFSVDSVGSNENIGLRYLNANLDSSDIAKLKIGTGLSLTDDAWVSGVKTALNDATKKDGMFLALERLSLTHNLDKLVAEAYKTILKIDAEQDQAKKGSIASEFAARLKSNQFATQAVPVPTKPEVVVETRK